MTIRIAAAAILRKNQILLVRKQNTVHFMQPGGKIEPGEEPLEALKRELAEELGFSGGGEYKFVATLHDTAVHEQVELVCDLFEIHTDQNLSAHAEIAEVRWVNLNEEEPGIPMAPLTENQILPRYKSKAFRI